MLEHVTRDIGPASPGLGMPWLQEHADSLIELTLPHRFQLFGLSESKIRELRKILEVLEQSNRTVHDDNSKPGACAVSLIDIGDDLSLDMFSYVPPTSPAIAIVGRDLPDVEKLLACGFVDYITYPFSTLEIQRRLFTMSTAIREATFSVGSSGDPMVRVACKMLETNIANPVTVDELAATLGTNRNTLNRAFNQAFGIGPITWLRQRRCELAAQLLRDGSESILNIALTVGYGDPNNFSTAFRRLYSQGPMEFRKKMSGAKNLGTASKAGRSDAV
ncbi:AraC-type DNA-binding protein [Rhizobium hainanense]|uniref:AraC-type DNA-binding protein n=2 Tax=Rhizobium hainanense TaxID=52131 RepID=A0A1C3VB28_9HYPH|nr:AraC-type DNA-binding protein [Rhizobium hainanense]